VLESKIPLGEVQGRIDHLTVDLDRQRLYVAELGNNTVGVIDLKARRVIRNLTGLREPQGIAYEPSTDTLYVANAGDGSVRLYRGSDLAPIGAISLGDDADNVRVDRAAKRVFVGYGDGALAVIDAVSRKKLADIPLKGHPESFQLSPTSAQIFVNVPDAHEIAVIDRNANRQMTSWSTKALRANFPLAVHETGRQVFAVFRQPSKLAVFNAQDGAMLTEVDVCGDADDVFIDAKRRRAYIICGEGFIDVLSTEGSNFSRIGRIGTSSGSRTGLLVSELDRLFIAVRATPREAAAVWVFRPD
jgi:YVTN family beta-propeller protein